MYISPDFDSKPQALQTRIKTERRIVKMLVREFLAQGFALSVYDGGDYSAISTDRKVTIDAIMETDEDVLHVYESEHALAKHLGYVLLVYGNDGWDVISDYSCKLEAYMPKTLALTEKLGE